MRKRLRESSKKVGYIRDIPQNSLENDGDKTTALLKFNFHYLTSGVDAGLSLEEWASSGEGRNNRLLKLVEKIKQFSGMTLIELRQTMTGGGKKSSQKSIIRDYVKFPAASKYKSPKHVPHDVHWSCIRLDNLSRLCGFTIPESLDNKFHAKTGRVYDKNTFYIVFLDEGHNFWPT